MAKQTRLENFNNWPKSKLFEAEETFYDKLKTFKYEELFIPCKIKENNDYRTHIYISYLLDMVDSLPKRPDHSFDWVWRAFEFILGNKLSNQNITSNLRKIVDNIIQALGENINLKKSFYLLINEIPLQTCEYLLKRILEANIFDYSNEKEFKKLPPFSKRLLTDNGNSDLLNPSLQKLLSYISNKYDYKESESRRNGALLIKKALSGIEVKNKLNNEKIKLDDNDIVLLLLSGLGYSFRNDRAHAKSISPFRSSKASIKTYAHCWFMFLLIYEVLNICLIEDELSIVEKNEVCNNININTISYLNLFKNQTNR